MRHHPISSSLFQDRRKAFMRHMKSPSVALFFSNEHMTRSGDQSYPYRQDPALFAMTGIDQPGTVLILIKDGERSDELLFILPNDPDHAIWNGERLSRKQAANTAGIDHVYAIDQLDRKLKKIFSTSRTAYMILPEKEKDQQSLFDLRDLQVRSIQRKFPSVTFLDAQQILRGVTMIKHKAEIELLKNAIQVTGTAFRHVLKMMKPGIREFEVEAELTYHIIRHGCRHAFEPIVASGRSACILHYITNDRIIKPGTLVLMDFGAEYANMASDMSRTIPSNGRFTAQQIAIYRSVLNILKETTQMMRTGSILGDLTKEAGKMIESELIGLKILSRNEVKKQNAKHPLWKKYFMHGVSHHLGYDVHDLADRSVPLRAGMVLTCEPGLYIPELGIGIRLENDILVTRGNPVNLMADIPIEPEEIESLMQA